MDGTFAERSGFSLTFPEAALIALSGVLIVFLILAALAFTITCISRVFTVMQERRNAVLLKELSPESAPQKPAAGQPDRFCGEVALTGVDEKTAACLMAIISSETNIPLDQLIFKSIKAL